MVTGVYDIPGMIKGFQGLNMFKTWGACEVDVEEEDESIAISGEDGDEVVVKEDLSEITVKKVDSPVIDAMVGFGPGWAAWLDSAQGAFGSMGQNQMSRCWTCTPSFPPSVPECKELLRLCPPELR